MTPEPTDRRVALLATIQTMIAEAYPLALERMSKGHRSLAPVDSTYRIYCISVNGSRSLFFSERSTTDYGTIPLQTAATLLDVTERLRLLADMWRIIANY